MRILFVFNHPAPYKVNLLNELSIYHKIDVIFERKKNSNRPKDFYYKEEYHFNQKFIKGLPFGDENIFSLELKTFIKNNHKNYDLIIMNGYSTLAEIIAIKYMIKNKIPYALYINGGVIKKDSKPKLKFKRKLISNAFCYFSPSKKADEYLIHYGASPKDIHHYVYSTIYKEEIYYGNNKKHISSINEMNFVTFGQFISRKNNMQLLEISKQFGLKLTLIGSGVEEQKYRDYINDNNISHLVSIKPFLKHSDLLKELRNYDCFITLSKEDIYGHMINEALSQGLPTICSNKIVSAYKLINKESGIMVNIDSNLDIESALNYIFNNYENFKCQSISEQNTIEAMIESHLTILKEMEK
ncbi:MAG: glycosyltransferase [Erysipelotrichales bacterium]|nr:glycosyltransferase [Erysipelotrichales bacterium]